MFTIAARISFEVPLSDPVVLAVIDDAGVDPIPRTLVLLSTEPAATIEESGPSEKDDKIGVFGGTLLGEEEPIRGDVLLSFDVADAPGVVVVVVKEVDVEDPAGTVEVVVDVVVVDLLCAGEKSCCKEVICGGNIRS